MPPSLSEDIASAARDVAKTGIGKAHAWSLSLCCILLSAGGAWWISHAGHDALSNRLALAELREQHCREQGALDRAAAAARIAELSRRVEVLEQRLQIAANPGDPASMPH